MAQEWHYKFMGETVGPLSTSEFREHIADRRVQPDTLVTRDGTDDWVSADRIKGLFDADGVLLPQPEKSGGRNLRRPCPACGEQIKDAARKCRFCGEMISSRGGSRSESSSNSNTKVWIIVAVAAGGLLFVIPCFIALMLPATQSARVQQARAVARRSDPVIAPEQASTTSIPRDVTYTVINEDIVPGQKRGLDIRLNKKVSQDVLQSIAVELKNSDSSSYERTFIGYYLPNMKVGEGCWATTHFNPTLEVKIIGLTGKQEEFLRQPTVDPTREVIGSWFDGRPNVGGKIVIFFQGPKLFMESTYKDGSSAITELIHKKSRLGVRFDNVEGSSFGDHWILGPDLNLQLRDDEGLITTCSKIK